MFNYRLPARPSPADLAEFRSALLENADQDINIDLHDVEKPSTPLLQVLMSAQKTWEKAGRNYQIGNMQEPFLSTVRLLGLGQSQLRVGEN